MGYYGPHRPLMGLYGPLWASTGLKWASLGLSWPQPASHGPLRATHGPLRAIRASHGPLRATWACHGPLLASSDVYVLRASSGLSWASPLRTLRASTGLTWTSTALYLTQPASDGSLLDSLMGFLVTVPFPWLPRSPFCSGGGSGGRGRHFLLHLEICLVGHTVLGAGWSP